VIRLALPTGPLRRDTAAFLDAAGCGINEYSAGSRALRFEMPGGAGFARVFREKDIPAQVALGNYDLGICSSHWVEELAQRFPQFGVLSLSDLGYGRSSLWLATRDHAAEESVRIASEYPNLADAVARRARLPRYRIYPVWGAADAYPPEDADLALVAAVDGSTIERDGLTPVAEVLRGSAILIGNRASLASRDLSPLLERILRAGSAALRAELRAPSLSLRTVERPRQARLRLALPDGHAQSHTFAVLQAAGIAIDGYDDELAVRRPRIAFDGVDVKVIRPQDMPQQVAIGNFDVAITGRDWLFDHLVQFPSSPVEEVLDLRRSRYGLAAIVKDVPADSVAGALAYWQRTRPGKPVRIASEYPNIADHFARERHAGRYSVIPIAGASEGFVPDDAEILIEGIDTGSSVRANKLTVLERFFESTNCLIANKRRPEGPLRAVYDGFVERLHAAVQEPVAAGGS